MKIEQGFSLVELLIVIAIIAIIAGMAIPNLLISRMAANEAGAVSGCRTIGSAEVVFSTANNQLYTDLAGLVNASALDQRFLSGFNGYQYNAGTVANTTAFLSHGPFLATPISPDSTGRFNFGIGVDQVVRYMGVAGSASPAQCGGGDCSPGDPYGKN